MGGARSHGDLGHHGPGAVRGGGRRPYRPQGHCRRRYHQPAGDGDPVGPPDRTAGVQCHCVAVPPDGEDLRPAEGRRPWRNGDGKDRPADRRLFFRYEAEVDHGQQSRRPPAGGAGRTVRRDGGQLAYLEPDRREGPCDGLFQRQPYHAVQYPYPAMGPGALCRAGHPHGPAAGAEVQQRGLRPASPPVRRRTPTGPDASP